MFLVWKLISGTDLMTVISNLSALIAEWNPRCRNDFGIACLRWANKSEIFIVDWLADDSSAVAKSRKALFLSKRCRVLFQLCKSLLSPSRLLSYLRSVLWPNPRCRFELEKFVASRNAAVQCLNLRPPASKFVCSRFFFSGARFVSHKKDDDTSSAHV